MGWRPHAAHQPPKPSQQFSMMMNEEEEEEKEEEEKKREGKENEPLLDVHTRSVTTKEVGRS